jgi:hypothetical protein
VVILLFDGYVAWERSKGKKKRVSDGCLSCDFLTEFSGSGFPFPFSLFCFFSDEALKYHLRMIRAIAWCGAWSAIAMLIWLRVPQIRRCLLVNNLYKIENHSNKDTIDNLLLLVALTLLFASNSLRLLANVHRCKACT